MAYGFDGDPGFVFPAPRGVRVGVGGRSEIGIRRAFRFPGFFGGGLAAAEIIKILLKKSLRVGEVFLFFWFLFCFFLSFLFFRAFVSKR